jgi:hypothetical protein
MKILLYSWQNTLYNSYSLHLLGLDDNKLTYFHAVGTSSCRSFGGRVIPELLA